MLAFLNPPSPSFAVVLMVYFDLCSNLQPHGHSGFANPSPFPPSKTTIPVPLTLAGRQHPIICPPPEP